MIDRVQNKEQLGKNIAIFRKRANLTQADLGNAIGVDRNTVTSYESGKAQPPSITLAMIARVCGCTTDDLLSSDPDKISRLVTEEQFNEAILKINTRLEVLIGILERRA